MNAHPGGPSFGGLSGVKRYYDTLPRRGWTPKYGT
jgi:hypothetical protein